MSSLWAVAIFGPGFQWKPWTLEKLQHKFNNILAVPYEISGWNSTCGKNWALENLSSREYFTGLHDTDNKEQIMAYVSHYHYKRPGQTIATLPNVVESNIAWRCCTVLNKQHLESRVWDQNIPRVLRKQPRYICLLKKNGARPIDLRVGPSSRFSWSYRFTYSFALSFSISREIVCV